VDTLFRWSKLIDADDLEEWETRLVIEEVPYSAEMLVRRQRWRLSAFSADRAEVESWKGRYGGGVNRVRPEDWQPGPEEDGERVLRIRDRLIVTGATGERRIALEEELPDRIVLSFPPQLAFGTGEHPTTANCLRFLVDWVGERERGTWRLLDLGCGSGILAVAAAKLGAREVVAIELDSLAMDCAKRNAERHDVAERVCFIEADAGGFLEDGGEGVFDVIAANLFSELLISTLPYFASNATTEAEVILSGFLTSQARDVSLAAEKAGFPLADFLRRGKWVAARGRRKE